MDFGDADKQHEENLAAWNQDTYPAWVARFGTPDEAAAKIARDPAKMLAPLTQYLGALDGARVVSVMGSNGTKAVAAALFGARATVIDASESNARYARELAASAGVDLEYIVSDILSDDAAGWLHRFDLAIAELGIVHYFTDLIPLMTRVAELLVDGGRFILRDFHPVSTKLLSFRGSTAKVRKYRVSGDYFSDGISEEPVSYAKHTGNEGAETPPKVKLRKWTLGEIVTAVAQAGFRVELLVEEPNLSSDVFDVGIPKTFTLVSTLRR